MPESSKLKRSRAKQTVVSLVLGVVVGLCCHALPPQYQVYCGLIGKFLIYVISAGVSS